MGITGLFWIRQSWWAVFHSKSGSLCHPVPPRVMLPQQGILPPQHHPVVLPLQGSASTPASSCACSLGCGLWCWRGDITSERLRMIKNITIKCRLAKRNLWLLHTTAIYCFKSCMQINTEFTVKTRMSLMSSVWILFRLNAQVVCTMALFRDPWHKMWHNSYITCIKNMSTVMFWKIIQIDTNTVC